MEQNTLDALVKQLVSGFDALQEEYLKLHGQHQALERKLATARDQYNKLARQYEPGQSTTPPLSLTSAAPAAAQPDTSSPLKAADVLDKSLDAASRGAATVVRIAASAVDGLNGIKKRSGSTADAREVVGSVMPSISESPLEQDFTIEGKPSKLGCPFASMANKKLSSHAASVLSRYNSNGSPGGAVSVLSGASRIDGRESLSRRRSRRESFVDPIKAEICGLSEHREKSAKPEATAASVKDRPDTGEVGVCPIRFLDEHSPEEVATYFEKHKHELPRSHEDCVMRYQSNEDQIKQLDAKYGNLVSMIAGLGQKHKDMLPAEPEDIDDTAAVDAESDEKVRKWATSVSAQADVPDEVDERDEPERLPYFERPLRDVRVGESPSRPWGIPVPAKYLDRTVSHTSSTPAQVTTSAVPLPPGHAAINPTRKDVVGKCPFANIQATADIKNEDQVETPARVPETLAPHITAAKPVEIPEATPEKVSGNRMVFNGPVFFGYGADDMAKLLKDSGLGKGP